MSKNLDERILKEMEKIELGLEDTFPYRCRACGKCCKNREDITLSAYDIFRLSRFLGRTPEEITSRYCEVQRGTNSHLPVVWLKPIPPDNTCPFLRNKRCFVHAVKPCVCRVYPLMRAYHPTGSARFYLMNTSCAEGGHQVKVRDWIGDLASEESDQVGRVWTDVLFCLAYAIDPSRFPGTAKQRQEIFHVITTMLYLPYDIGKPFQPQLEANVEILRTLLREKYSLEIPTAEEYQKIVEPSITEAENSSESE